MALNRHTAPANGVFRATEIPSLEAMPLSSGVVAYHRRTSAQGLLRLDLMVRAGSGFQPRPLLSQLSDLLLKEGCREVRDASGQVTCSALSTAETADLFDRYGAYVYYSTMMEYVIVTVCVRTEYLAPSLTLLRNLYAFPAYPEEGIRLNLELRQQQWKIDREKVQVAASMKMNELLFGADHPYGRMLREEDFQAVDRAELLAFHDRFYRPENTLLVATGDVGEQELAVMERIFGVGLSRMLSEAGETVEAAATSLPDMPPPHPSAEKTAFISKPGALQAAVRFSLPAVGQQHPDFHGLQILNALLGGYFGSRLMTSLREEKGYTYGIQSTHTVYRDYSYIDIETQTAVGFVEPLIDGVWAEMDRLVREPVTAAELDRLRNHLYGEYARMVDGPFAFSDLFLSARMSGEEMSECFARQLEAVGAVTPDDLQRLARTYLRKEDFFLVKAGG